MNLGSRRLELTFSTAELREICEDRAVAINELGPILGMELGARLADIEAVDTLDELRELHFDDLGEPDGEEVRLRVGANTYLALAPGGAKPARHGDGRVNWSELDRLCVTRIDANHG